MINQSIVRRLLLGAATGLALAVTAVSVPIVAASLTPAIAQSSEDMTAALDAYGHWVRHPSYGEVWVPDGVPPGWRPYEYGRWVFTDDWGWYWVSDESEDDWGWVVYHYGRWAVDRRLGWFWVPGDEWAPAWVDWRYGGDNVGWAPLPPDDLMDTYDQQPDYWMFVPLRYIAEPRVRTHFVPRDRRMIHFAPDPPDQPPGPCGRPAALGQSGPRARVHCQPYARGFARLQCAPARVRHHVGCAGRINRAPGRPAHQRRGQAHRADYRAANHHDDPGDHLDGCAESARQG